MYLSVPAQHPGVNSCYSGWRTGYKESTKSQCPAGDFSMTIDQPNDIQTKWDNSNKKLSVKYGGKWRTYKTATANRKYNNGGKDCFEWYDEYEPTTCNQ
ncbi:hypothetical protein GGI12_004946 [Dipsacomyces acuminosporus]|nr:hypothetical protein GGI12_004946 [Dipsacomyces acuminosporus]